MKQTTFTRVIAQPKTSKINLAMMLISGICLSAVFYFNGTFSKMFAKPEPPSHSSNAAGGPIGYKTNEASSVSNVVNKALAFKALLSNSQQTTLELTYTSMLARKWSNLPCGAGCRNGIQFGALNAAQLAAALEVIKAATGNTTNDGYEEFIQIRLAEANLKANGGGNGYDTTLRWIAFLNTPTASGAWMLQFGGHHYAANISFNNGNVIGATPFFMGLEPASFTLNSVTYAPLNDEHNALTAMLASLTAAQLTTAKLNTTFSDCTMVPGESNGGTGTFPATKVGLVCSGLTSAQQNLVLDAIKHYVQDVDSTTAAAVMAVYTSEISQTYIAYTGSGTSGNASSFLSTNSNYVRIDGPTVWIELACQNGVVYPSQIHYHTIWRDHSHDYGVDLTGTAIDGTSTATGIAEIKNNSAVKIYPNPASTQLSLSVTSAIKDGKMTIVNASSGQTMDVILHLSGSSLQYDVSALPAGLYILRIEDGSAVFTGKFSKQ